MPTLSKDKIYEIRRAIRDYRAVDPLATTDKIRKHLFENGYRTSKNKLLDWTFVDRQVKKVRAEVLADIDNKKLKERVAETRERFRIVIEQMSRIALSRFSQTTEKIKALETIAKLDLALLGAEMDAGIFERAIGTMKVEHDLSQEERERIMSALKQWGLLSRQKNPPIKIANYVSKTKQQDSAEQIVGQIVK